MAAIQEDSPAPSVRFKRRKIAHPKRTYLDDGIPTVATAQTPESATPNDTPVLLEDIGDAEESMTNLREIIRNRKRPRDRLRDAARKVEAPRTELTQVDAPRPDQYTSRFIAQTGQVVDHNDTQM